jgi:cytochrome c553
MKSVLATAATAATAGVIALGASAPVHAQAKPGNADAARSKVSMCVGCHGIPDYRTAFPTVYHVPKIAGQTAEYLAAALNAYKVGERSHPTMQGIAKTLSEQDIADLAAYYAAAVGGAKR